MKYVAFPADQLSPSHVQTWSQLVEADPALDSPYFRPDFTRAVAAVRPGTQITVLEDQGSIVGFLPYHRDRGRVGSPVADSLTDFQAAIVAAGTMWEPAQLVRDSGLSALYLDRTGDTRRRRPTWIWPQVSTPIANSAAGWARTASAVCCRNIASWNAKSGLRGWSTSSRSAASSASSLRGRWLSASRPERATCWSTAGPSNSWIGS
jgi:hypothetical protein